MQDSPESEVHMFEAFEPYRKTLKEIREEELDKFNDREEEDIEEEGEA